ncbi:MAG: hypothetical protein LBU65_10110, partial [Planctomycetaceae bacterium]|nr:hypothetical protein [Planctomycetaceae bacterium]
NMPETAPCSVTVQKDGVPVSDVDVTLYTAGGNGSMIIRGKTDGAGVAKISTSWGEYITDGAPIGICKITLDKNFEMPNPPKVMEDEPSWSPAQWEKYERDYNAELDKRRVIPKNLTDSTTTPFEVEISPKSGGKIYG